MHREWLGYSQIVGQHPIREEKLKYKLSYVQMLYYFVNKYNKEDSYAQAVLDYYTKVLLGSDRECYTYQEQDIQMLSKKVLGLRFKNWRVVSYHYVFLIDCLAINAFFDEEKAKSILEELQRQCKSRYIEQLQILFEVLYKDKREHPVWTMTESLLRGWECNCLFKNKSQLDLMITANMSAGKSTLLNALCGKKVNKTQQDVCTAKLHYIQSKPFEDGTIYKRDHNFYLEASKEVLMSDHEGNQGLEISVGTYFRSLCKEGKKVCLIDTPGVNSSLDINHKNITHEALRAGYYHKVLYVLNAENIGTDDDKKYLEYMKSYVDRPIIFIVNKLDRYRVKEDSIASTLDRLRADLVEIGFEEPTICPLSAYAGYLAKMKIMGEPLNEDEEDELEFFLRKFKKEEYNLAHYYPHSQIEVKEWMENEFEEYRELLVNSGLYGLEQIIYE